MRVIAVTVPAKLTEPPHHYPMELLHDLARLNSEGHIIRYLDNALWRESEAAVLESIGKAPAETILLYGPVRALQNIYKYANLILKRWPQIHVLMTQTKSWMKVPLVVRPIPFYRYPSNQPNRMPYPQYGWLDLDAYFGLRDTPYGERPQTWKRWFEVPTDYFDNPYPARYVVDSMNYYRTRWGIDGVTLLGFPFSNVNFAYHFRKFMRLSDLCLPLSWTVNIDIHAINPTRLAWARDNNCAAIIIPLESSDTFLYDSEALAAAVDACAAIDLPVYVEFKVGWPEDSLEGYIAAVAFCVNHELECRPNLVSADDIQGRIPFQRIIPERIADYPPGNFTRWSMAQLLGLTELMRREDLKSLEELRPQSPSSSAP